MIKAIFFDFDGVIHNTFDFHYQKVKKFTKIDIEKDELRQMHYGNFFENKNRKLRDVDWASYPEFVFDEQSNLKLEDSTKKILKDLSDKHSIFLTSSGGEKNIKAYLKNNDIAKFFTEILGLESMTSKEEQFTFLLAKYNLNKNDCLFVTDTLGDVLEAKKVSIKTIAVTFGYHNEEILKKGAPYAIAHSFNEVKDVIKDLDQA